MDPRVGGKFSVIWWFYFLFSSTLIAILVGNIIRKKYCYEYIYPLETDFGGSGSLNSHNFRSLNFEYSVIFTTVCFLLFSKRRSIIRIDQNHFFIRRLFYIIKSFRRYLEVFLCHIEIAISQLPVHTELSTEIMRELYFSSKFQWLLKRYTFFIHDISLWFDFFFFIYSIRHFFWMARLRNNLNTIPQCLNRTNMRYEMNFTQKCFIVIHRFKVNAE